MKRRIERLEGLQGNNSFKILIVEKVKEDLYVQVGNRSKQFTKEDLDNLITFYNYDNDKQMKLRAEEIERKLFGNTK